MEYKKAFSELIDQLKSHAKVTVIESKVQPGISSDAISSLEIKSGLRLAKTIKDFYSEVNGITIQWAVKSEKLQGIKDADPPEDMVGSINILGLERMLFGGNEQQPWKDNLWFDFMKKEDIESLKDLRPFDLYNNDDKELVGFKKHKDELSDKLFYYNLEDGVLQFKMYMDEYLNSLILFKGFMFWQRAFLFPKSKYRKELQHYFPQIFPKDKIPLTDL